MPLLYAARSLDALKPANEDQRVGIDIIRRALQAPLRQIAVNAGVDASIVVGKLCDQADSSYGFDAQTSQYGDMFKAGIIDPVTVDRTAIQGAASVASLVITTEAMVCEIPDKAAPAMPGGGMGGMGGMGY